VGQEVFVKVWRGLVDFRRDRPGDRFRNWLYRIAHNCVADYFRQQHGPPPVGGSAAMKLLAELPSEDGSPMDSEDRKILYRQAVELIRSEFSERDWLAFQAVVMDDKSPAVVASSLGVTTNVVYLARSRVLGRLRAEFAGLIDF
jgi:RNA polymerase sigma-70 factor (ECF subfamily)